MEVLVVVLGTGLDSGWDWVLPVLVQEQRLVWQEELHIVVVYHLTGG